eukprot:103833_1
MSNYHQQGGYNDHHHSHQQQGGYNDHYNSRQQQGGYNDRHNSQQQQGGYNDHHNSHQQQSQESGVITDWAFHNHIGYYCGKVKSDRTGQKIFVDSRDCQKVHLSKEDRISFTVVQGQRGSKATNISKQSGRNQHGDDGKDPYRNPSHDASHYPPRNAGVLYFQTAYYDEKQMQLIKKKFGMVMGFTIAALVYVYFFGSVLFQPNHQLNLIKYFKLSEIQIEPLHIIHLIQGDNPGIIGRWTNMRDNTVGNDMIFFNFKDRRNISHNYYDRNTNIFHIYYNRRTTWSEGRNYLLQMSFELQNRRDYVYDYFAFFDDDVLFNQLDTCNVSWNHIYENEFKNDLKFYEPAIMFLGKKPHTRAIRVNTTRGCEGHVCSSAHHDAANVWIHKELIRNKFIFPYLTSLDHLSWYESQRHLWNLAYVMYYNHLLLFVGIDDKCKVWWENEQHTVYPKNSNSTTTQLNFDLLKPKLYEIFGSDDLYYKYYYNYSRSASSFVSSWQYRLLGYPQTKGNIHYDDYLVLNGTVPEIDI